MTDPTDPTQPLPPPPSGFDPMDPTRPLPPPPDPAQFLPPPSGYDPSSSPPPPATLPPPPATLPPPPSALPPPSAWSPTSSPPAGHPPLPPVVPTPLVRAAWFAAGSIAAVVTLLFGTVQTVGLLAHEERVDRVVVTDDAVRVLDVTGWGGRVDVLGADVDDIRITAELGDSLAKPTFTHRVVGDRLEVRTDCRQAFGGPWCKADLRIVVPRDLEVAVRTGDRGVAVRSVDGRVDASSREGLVDAEALGGGARLHATNGSVRGIGLRTASVEADSDNGSVRLELAVAPSSAIARSSNGSVDVAVPRTDQAYAVDATSSNGSTDNLVRTDSTSDHRIVAHSGNGSVTVRYVD